MSKSKGSARTAADEKEKNDDSLRETDRSGALSNGPLSPAEAAADEDMRDLFLSEENLIRLAIGHLGGRLPPGKGKNRQARNSVHQPTGPAQPARVRRLLAGKLQRELRSRSWTASELSEVCRLSVSDCRALLSGQAVFSQDAAKELAKAFATSVDYWMSDQDD